MILYESPLVKVEFDELTPCVTWTPLEFMNSQQFREPFKIGMDFYVEKIKEIPKLTWLNDARKLKSVKPDDVKWLDANVNDRAYKSGGTKVAFVLPDDTFGKMGIRLYAFFTTKRPDNKLAVKAFRTLEEAKLWLKGTEVTKLDEVRLTINHRTD